MRLGLRLTAHQCDQNNWQLGSTALWLRIVNEVWANNCIGLIASRKKRQGYMWLPVIPGFRRPRQEYWCELDFNLSYVVSSGLTCVTK